MTTPPLRSDGHTVAYKRVAATLAANWWTFAIRGVLGVLVGLAALALPGIPMWSFALPFAAYAFIDGWFGIAGAVRDAEKGGRSGFLLTEGIVNQTVASEIASLWYGNNLLAFVLVLAAWAVLTGALMLGASSRLETSDGRWWFALGGVFSVLYGILLIITRMINAVTLAPWFGAYALAFGVALLVAALKLKAQSGSVSNSTPRQGSIPDLNE
jgi:uncharacterized membrane protein HdeD (DUF308 family)